MVAKIVTVIC